MVILYTQKIIIFISNIIFVKHTRVLHTSCTLSQIAQIHKEFVANGFTQLCTLCQMYKKIIWFLLLFILLRCTFFRIFLARAKFCTCLIYWVTNHFELIKLIKCASTPAYAQLMRGSVTQIAEIHSCGVIQSSQQQNIWKIFEKLCKCENVQLVWRTLLINWVTKVKQIHSDYFA